MAYTYKITDINPSDKRIDVYFNVKLDGKKLGEEIVQISADALKNQPSDGRIEYIQQVVSDACKKFMVIEDVKMDFSSIVGNEYTLDGVVYETKAERVARVDAFNAMMEAQRV